jgi:hypothetical protein
MSLVTQNESGINKQRATLPPSYVPGKVSKVNVPGFDDLHLIVDAQGDLHTFGRIINEPLNKETFGDQGARLQQALVQLEEFALRNGYKFRWHRVSNLEAAHRTSDPQYSVTNAEQSAYVISAVWVKAKKGVEGTFGTSPTPVQQVTHKITGYESIHADFEHEADILADPFMSTKGVGIGNLPILAPAFQAGLSGKHTSATSWDMAVEMILSTEASFYDKCPEIRPFSRQSFKSGTLVGVGDRADSEVREFSLSLPLKVEDMKKLLKNPMRMYKLLRRAGVELPPLEERLVPVLPLRGPHAAFIESQQSRFDIPGYGGCNQQTGRGIVRMVVLGEPFGEFGSGKGGITQMELVQRACQMIVNLLEKTAADELLEEGEQRRHPDPQRRYGTFTFNFLKSNINYAGIDPQESGEITNILITCPFEELSLAARRMPLRYADGSIVPTYVDEKTGIIYYEEKRSYQPAYAQRDAFNGPANKGVSGLGPHGAKCAAHESPIDVDLSWEDREMNVIIRYNNALTPDFIPTSYANDNAQANIQAMGVDMEGLARSLIIHIGTFIDWEHYQRTGERRGIPPMQAVQGWIDKFIHSKEVYESGPFQPSSRKTGFQGEYLEILRDPISHEYQWYDRHSPFGELIEAVQTDVKRNARVQWVDPSFTNGEKKYGYAIFEQFAGLDLELPMHGYVLYFLAYIANCLDKINSELPEGKHFRVHQTDLVRQWDEFYRFIRSLQEMKAHFENEISQVIFERINHGATTYGAPPLTKPIQLKLSITGEELIELFSKGEKYEEILARISDEAITYYRNDLQYHNERRGETIYTDNVFRALEIAPSLIKEKVEESLKGGAREYRISDTQRQDVTFRFMLIVRGEVKSEPFDAVEIPNIEQDLPFVSIDADEQELWNRFVGLSPEDRSREALLGQAIVGDDDSVLTGLLTGLISDKVDSLDYEMAEAWQAYASEQLLHTNPPDYDARRRKLVNGVDCFKSLNRSPDVQERIERYFLNFHLSDAARARAEAYLQKDSLTFEERGDLLKMVYALLSNPGQLSLNQYTQREALHRRLFDLIGCVERPPRTDQRFDQAFSLLEQDPSATEPMPNPVLQEISHVLFRQVWDDCLDIASLYQGELYQRGRGTAERISIEERLKKSLLGQLNTFFGI